MNSPAYLPYGRHLIEEDDIAAVANVLRSDFLTTGPVIEEFESSVTKRTGAGHAVACANGTAGLHLAAIALGLGPGDSVIVPTLTFLATASAARYVGAEVVFADVDAETGLLTALQLGLALDEAERRGMRIRSVFPVHFAGQAVPMRGLRQTLDVRGYSDASIVEDACHAIGTRMIAPENSTVGDCANSQMAVFSLHPVKTVAMGEGGVVTTNDADLAARLRRARNHGMVREPEQFKNRDLAFDRNGMPNPWYYEMHAPGYNYRASAIHCGLGLNQLTKLDRFVARRRELVARYDDRLRKLAPRVVPLGRSASCEPAWHLYVVRIDFEGIGKGRASVMRALLEQGIGTQVHYMPLHLQPYYRDRYGISALRNAEALYATMLSLPLFPAMADGDVDRVVSALGDIVG
jgi:UDP-4-amino-4,6-dideoxy-N-acetyl-beta-L-altrosamine transaminase